VLLLVLLALVVLVGADDPVAADVALLLEQAGDLRLQARARDLQFSWSAWFAFLIRASMSAIGSVCTLRVLVSTI